MGAGDTDFLISSYSDRIGTPSTADEAYGYWVFVLGVLAGFVGIGLVMVSDSPGAISVRCSVWWRSCGS